MTDGARCTPAIRKAPPSDTPRERETLGEPGYGMSYWAPVGAREKGPLRLPSNRPRRAYRGRVERRVAQHASVALCEELARCSTSGRASNWIWLAKLATFLSGSRRKEF